jgi:hypothetical protein
MSQDYFEPINWGNKKNKKKTAKKSFRGGMSDFGYGYGGGGGDFIMPQQEQVFVDDFFDNYESLLCSIMKQSENFSGPFVDVYKLDNNKIKEINNILENYKIKKK